MLSPWQRNVATLHGNSRWLRAKICVALLVLYCVLSCARACECVRDLVSVLLPSHPPARSHHKCRRPNPLLRQLRTHFTKGTLLMSGNQWEPMGSSLRDHSSAVCVFPLLRLTVFCVYTHEHKIARLSDTRLNSLQSAACQTRRGLKKNKEPSEVSSNVCC